MKPKQFNKCLPILPPTYTFRPRKHSFFKAVSYFIRLADTRVEVQTEGGFKNIERQI